MLQLKHILEVADAKNDNGVVDTEKLSGGADAESEIYHKNFAWAARLNPADCLLSDWQKVS
jgi:hypothetical protein